MLLSEITIEQWKAALTNNVTFDNDNDKKIEILNDVLTTLYFRNISRIFRSNIVNNWETIGSSYIRANLKKIDLLLSTSYQDFLASDQKATSTGVNTDYNIDYYGGEGERTKDTNDLVTTYSNINNKDKLRNYKDISRNSIFKELLNILFETFIPGGDWNDYV